MVVISNANYIQVTAVPPEVYKQISNNQDFKLTKKVLLVPCNYQIKCLSGKI